MTGLRVALALGAVLALPSAAQAGTVTSDGTTITFTALVSAENVTLGVDGSLHTVRSDKGVTTSTPCTSVPPDQADCPGSAFVVSFVGTENQVDGGNVTSAARLTANGSPGDDRLNGTPNADRLDGNDGSDNLNGGAGDDTLTGGAGDNFYDDGPGRDTIIGGPANDTLNAGAGPDVFTPGAGSDTVSYSGRASGVTITFNGLADDGEPGEGDNVGADAEQGDGGAGNDVLVGNNLGVALNGGAGNDAITGGTAEDRLVGNEGDDTIDARDGRFDSVDCGTGNDVVYADLEDRTENCEVAPDADGDGFGVPADCAPFDRAINPGAGEIIGNPVDEDCKGGPGYARVVSPVSFSIQRQASRNRMRFTKLTVGEIKSGDKIEIRCSTKSRGCPFTRKTVTGKNKRTVSVLTSFKKRYLRKGAVIEVRTTRPNEIGSVRRLKVGNRGVVRSEILCLAVGATTPTRCA